MSVQTSRNSMHVMTHIYHVTVTLY